MTHSGEPPPEKPADTNRVRMLRRSGFVALLCAALACAASAANENWAAAQIRAVTQIGVLGSSVSSFAPQSPLTQGALATAVAAVDTLQHPAAPKPEPPALTSTVGPDATIAGSAPVDVEVTGEEGPCTDLLEGKAGFGQPAGDVSQKILPRPTLSEVPGQEHLLRGQGPQEGLELLPAPALFLDEGPESGVSSRLRCAMLVHGPGPLAICLYS